MGKKRKHPRDDISSSSDSKGAKAGAPTLTTISTTVPSARSYGGPVNAGDNAPSNAHTDVHTHAASAVPKSPGAMPESLGPSASGKRKRVKHEALEGIPPSHSHSSSSIILHQRSVKKSRTGHTSCILSEGNIDNPSRTKTKTMTTTRPTAASGSNVSITPSTSSTTLPAGSWILGIGGTASTSKSAPSRLGTHTSSTAPPTASKRPRKPSHPSLPARPPSPLAGLGTKSTLSASVYPPILALPPSPPSLSTRFTPSEPSRLSPQPPTSYVTASGTVLNLRNAGFVLSAYLQSFGHDPSQFRMTTTFALVPSPTVPIRTNPPKTPKPRESHQPPPDHLFHCTITLPQPCPIRSMTSPAPGLRSKALAKKHAQMELVWALIAQGQIGEDLKPLDRVRNKAKHYERIAAHIHRRTRDSLSPPGYGDPMRATKIDSFKKAMVDRVPNLTPGNQVIPGQGDYPYVPRASFWEHCAPFKAKSLWPTLFQIRLEGDFAHRTEECRVVCLLTSRPLPVFGESGEFILDLTMASVGAARTKVPASVRLVRGRKMKQWEEGNLRRAMEYTLRLIRAHINKPVLGDLEASKWLVVPMLPEWRIREKVKLGDISWSEVEQAVTGPLWVPFSFDDPAKLEKEIDDAMTTPRAEFSRRLFVRGIRTDLTAESPHPEDPSRTILGYLPMDVELTAPSQPIIEGEQVNTIRHGGFIAGLANAKLTGKVAIPEVVQRHCISASVFKTTSALPQALGALDDLLVARDFSDRVFHSRLDAPLALTALSCPTSHGQKTGKSYERLEMLGDTLLKLLVVVYLLYDVQEDEIDWDEVHREKQIMVTNRTLQNHAIKAGVVPYIRGANAQNRQWLPMGWVALTNPPNEERRREREEAARASQERDAAGDDTVEEQVGERTDHLADRSPPTNGSAAPGSSCEDKTSLLPVASEVTPMTDHEVAARVTRPCSSSASASLASPTLGQHPDRLRSVEWSTKKLKANDPLPTTQQLGDKVSAGLSHRPHRAWSARHAVQAHTQTIADVSEAVVAASYLSENRHIDGAISAMHILGMRLSRFKDWNAVVTASKAKNQALRSSEQAERKGVMPLKVLGYEFAVGTNGRDALVGPLARLSAGVSNRIKLKGRL